MTCRNAATARRHDHGGGGAAARTSRSRPTPTSTTRSPISAAAAPSSRCARRSTPRPTRDEGGNHELRSEDRSPLLRRRHRRGRRRLLARHEPAVRRRATRQDGTPELNAWVVVQARRHRRRAHRPLRDGPGLAHRPLPAGRRRARMRLVEGHLGICRPAREHHAASASTATSTRPAAERHPPVARLCAAGRRGGAADADPGRRQRVEGAGLGMHRGQQRDHAHAVRPQDQLRQGRRTPRPRSSRRIRRASSSRTRRTGRSPASRSQRLDTHGQAHRQAEVLGRHPAARHAQRRDQGLPGARRQARELRRRQGQRHAGREERRRRSATTRSRSSPTPGGTPRRRSMRCR